MRYDQIGDLTHRWKPRSKLVLRKKMVMAGRRIAMYIGDFQGFFVGATEVFWPQMDCLRKKTICAFFLRHLERKEAREAWNGQKTKERIILF